MALFPKREDEAPGHPSEDTTGRFPLDALLRSKGYTIHSRRRNEVPVWQKKGKLFTELQLYCRLTREEKETVKQQMKQYYRELDKRAS